MNMSRGVHGGETLYLSSPKGSAVFIDRLAAAAVSARLSLSPQSQSDLERPVSNIRPHLEFQFFGAVTRCDEILFDLVYLPRYLLTR